MADNSETLWTGFNNRKIAAERAKKDWNGRLLSDIASANDSTITIKVADSSTGPTAGSFTTNQSSAGTITIPAAASASGGGEATPGVMSSADKTKLDGISTGATRVEEDQEHYGSILVDGSQVVVYVHPSAGPASTTSVGDTQAQTPGFGDTFKVTSETVDADGHTTTVAEHTVTIPSALAVPSTGGTGGSAGLMSAADKEKLDNYTTTVNDGTLSITVGSGTAQTFTANQATSTSVTIPNAASASGGTSATGGLMTATDKDNLDNAAAVIPSAASSSNQLVDRAAMEAAMADFGGFKVVQGTGQDLHPSVQDPSTTVIYLVHDGSATGDDKYKEWIYDEGDPSAVPPVLPSWKLIGDTTMDLDGYVELPSTHTDTHLVAFGSNDDIVDSGKTVADLENAVTTVSVGSGSPISPTSGTTDINIPVATTSADGAMSSTDKGKLEGIETGAEVNVIEGITLNGSAVSPDANRTVNLSISSPSPSDSSPQMDGTAAAGSSTDYSRADHVHPSDSAKADKAVPSSAGNLATLNASGNLADSGIASTGVKTKQAPVADSDATTSGTGVTFVDAVTQNANGEISVHKKTVQTVQKSTATVGGNDGLMTAQQAEALYDLNSWTYATFGDSGSGSEQSVVFPVAAS